jgi:hypothetical protein
MAMQWNRNLRGDARLASAFATLVCAWALALVVLGLATSVGTDPVDPAPVAAATDARR